MKRTPFFCLIFLFVCSLGITCPALGAVPVASFISNASAGNVPFAVQFMDSSLNSPTSWTWLFGDGGISTLQNPSHIYTTPGSYTVTLITANSAGTNTATYQGYITATKAASVPMVSFVTNITSGAPPLTVQFLDTSSNSPATWVWSFGDGGTSTSPNPVHTYTSSGSFSVTLTATNLAGSNTTSLSNYITIIPVTVVPTAIFKTTVTSGYEPLTVQFVDASMNTPNSWVWSFGDGGTSSLQNPAHTYTAAGSYTVTLTASNIVGSNTVSQPGYITVNAAIPVAAFTSNVTSGTTPLNVQFTDTSNNIPTGWYWTFGDGGTSTLQNPTHTFSTVGTYAVSLGASNSAGSNTTTMPAYITVTNALTPPSSSFSADIRSGNAPLTVQFQDTSTDSPNGWQWLFGDGSTSTEQNPTHTYTTAGSYSVTLTAVNPGGRNTTVIPGYISVAEPLATATPTMVYASTTYPTAVLTTVLPTQAPSVAATTATPAPAGTAPSWTLPLIGIVILVLGVIAYILHSRGRSGGRRHSGRRREL